MARAGGQRRQLAKNIFQDDHGISGIARAGGLKPRELRFPTGTKVSAIHKALEAERVKMRAEAKVHRQVLRPGTLAGDVAEHLATLPAKRRVVVARELAPWVEALGPRQRSDIKVADLRAVVSKWLDATKPPAPNTIRLRRRALAILWDALDGEDAPNPARRVKPPKDRRAEARAWPIEALERVIARVKDRKKRARLSLLLWSGMPVGSLLKLRMRDIDLEAGTIHYPAREKAEGAPAVTLPMFFPQTKPAAQAWLRAFAWGEFDRHELLRRLKAAARVERRENDKANRPSPIDPARVRVHDLRHTFLTAVGRASKNPYVVQSYGQHLDLETSRRYCQDAVPDMVAAAVQAAHATPPASTVASTVLASPSLREAPRGSASLLQKEGKDGPNSSKTGR